MSQKIIDIHTPGKSLFAEYFEFLSAQQKWDWVVQNEDHFNQESIRTADAVLVDTTLSPAILPKLTTMPAQIRNIGCMDSLFKDDGSWYPRLLLFESLRQVIVDKAHDVDTNSPAFVVGDNEAACTAVAVLTHMGYSDVYMTSENEEVLKKVMSFLRQGHIGVKIHGIAASELTMHSVSCSIAVNCLPIEENKVLLADLSYFNFMKRTGIVVELNLLPVENVLLEESEKAGLRNIHPIEIAVKTTELWLERLGKKMKVEDIHQSWESFLKTKAVTK